MVVENARGSAELVTQPSEGGWWRPSPLHGYWSRFLRGFTEFNLSNLHMTLAPTTSIRENLRAR